MKSHLDFEQFFKENYSRFYYFALHLINDEETSKDIVSDCFEYAYNIYENSDIKDLKVYLYSYIKNKCVDYIRHQDVRRRYADYYIKSTPEFEDTGYDDYEERIKIVSSIRESLTPQTRLILKECYINNKKYKEVAEELNISVSAVRKHMVKALKVIREKSPKKIENKVFDF